jgi:hypothetical protein
MSSSAYAVLTRERVLPKFHASAYVRGPPVDRTGRHVVAGGTEGRMFLPASDPVVRRETFVRSVLRK